MKEGQKKIYELHDGVELSRSNGLTLLRHFKNYDNYNNVFNLFPILDVREDLITDYRKNLGFEIRLTKVRKESQNNVNYSFPAKKHSFVLEDAQAARYKNSWNETDSEGEDQKWNGSYNNRGSQNYNRNDSYNRKNSKSYNRRGTDKRDSEEYVIKETVQQAENPNIDLGLGIQTSIQLVKHTKNEPRNNKDKYNVDFREPVKEEDRRKDSHNNKNSKRKVSRK